MVTNEIVAAALPDHDHPSIDSIQARLSIISAQLTCLKCNKKSPEILRQKVPIEENSRPDRPVIFKVPQAALRYIDEGIGGTREENKRMRARQWASRRRDK